MEILIILFSRTNGQLQYAIIAKIALQLQKGQRIIYSREEVSRTAKIKLSHS